MIDFPANPVDGQEYTATNGAVYKWQANPGIWLSFTGSPDSTGSGPVVLQFSPTLTGDPKAPTAALGDNDTSIATTGFVQSARGMINVQSYGARPGETEGTNTTAFQAAIDVAGTTSTKCVFVPPGIYDLAALTMPWGVSMIGVPGSILHLSAPILINSPGLFDFTFFRDLQFAANGIVSMGINAVGEFENVSVGEIVGISLQSCQFIALDADIHNPGFRSSPTDFFQIALYMYDCAFASVADCTFMGGFEVSAPIALSEGSAAIKFDGQTVRFSCLGNCHMQSYCYGVWGAGAVEGFMYEGGEQIYVRKGIFVDTDAPKPGVSIKGGHFNVSEAGVHLRKRNGGFTVVNINAFTNTFYEDRPTWDAVLIEDCNDGIVSGVEARPSFGGGFTGVSTTVRFLTSARMTLDNVSALSVDTGVDIEGCAGVQMSNIGGNGLTTGINVDATSTDVSIGQHSFLNTANALTVSVSAARTMFMRRAARPDAGSTVITAAAVVSVDSRVSSWVRRVFQAGAGAYAYDLTLSATGAELGDKVMFTCIFQSINATVRILSNDATVLATFNAATGTYSCEAVFTGVWRKTFSCLNV